MTASNTYGRQVVVPLTNKSGGGVIAGDVVIVDTTNNDAFTTTTSANFTGGVGIAQDTIASNAVGRVLISGYASLINVNASVTRGHFGATFTVAKQATDAGAARGAGTFCQFLTGGTTPDAIVYPVDLLGTSLTNPMSAVDDMIIGTTGGAPARLTAAGAASKFLQTDGSNHVVWGDAPSSALTGSMNQLAAPVTMTNANQYYDGPAITGMANGTYLFTGTVTVDNQSGGGCRVTAKLWDGTNVGSSSQITSSANTNIVTLAVSAYIVISSGTPTWKISVAANAGSCSILAAANTNGAGNNASTLVAIKIA